MNREIERTILVSATTDALDFEDRGEQSGQTFLVWI